jgi:hypothetical protein
MRNDSRARAPVVAIGLVGLTVVVLHVVLANFAAVALAVNSTDPPASHCLGTWTGHTCAPAWGVWSMLMYAPEIAVGSVAAVAIRPGLRRAIPALGVAGFIGVAVFCLAVVATSGWAIGQMPVYVRLHL